MLLARFWRGARKGPAGYDRPSHISIVGLGVTETRVIIGRLALLDGTVRITLSIQVMGRFSKTGLFCFH